MLNNRNNDIDQTEQPVQGPTSKEQLRNQQIQELELEYPDERRIL